MRKGKNDSIVRGTIEECSRQIQRNRSNLAVERRSYPWFKLNVAVVFVSRPREWHVTRILGEDTRLVCIGDVAEDGWSIRRDKKVESTKDQRATRLKNLAHARLRRSPSADLHLSPSPANILSVPSVYRPRNVHRIRDRVPRWQKGTSACSMVNQKETTYKHNISIPLKKRSYRSTERS